jgi:hypothetical protein
VIVLNVGGGASRHLPPDYEGWQQDLLDIDPHVGADIVADARDMSAVMPIYDAVYCSHCVEHFYWHDVGTVLRNFRSVLKDGGHADVIVPDIVDAMRAMLARNLEPHDTFYRSASGPVTFHDVMYGWDQAMRGGNLYYAHKCGFSKQSLGQAMIDAGFKDVRIASSDGNLRAIGVR